MAIAVIQEEEREIELDQQRGVAMYLERWERCDITLIGINLVLLVVVVLVCMKVLVYSTSVVYAMNVFVLDERNKHGKRQNETKVLQDRAATERTRIVACRGSPTNQTETGSHSYPPFST